MGIMFRSAEVADIPALAAIRAAEWETHAYWTRRIGEYLPEKGAQDRMILIAENRGTVVGFVAGHRTRRYGCDGELQWVNVSRDGRRRGIGAMLVQQIGFWFVDQGARRICVDVEPDNIIARGLYSRCGAKPFKPYWMIWENSRDMIDQRSSHLDAQSPMLFGGLDGAAVMDQVEIRIEDPQPDLGAVEKAFVNARENRTKLRQPQHRPGGDPLDRHGRENR